MIPNDRVDALKTAVGRFGSRFSVVDWKIDSKSSRLGEIAVTIGSVFARSISGLGSTGAAAMSAALRKVNCDALTDAFELALAKMAPSPTTPPGSPLHEDHPATPKAPPGPTLEIVGLDPEPADGLAVVAPSPTTGSEHDALSSDSNMDMTD